MLHVSKRKFTSEDKGRVKKIDRVAPLITDPQPTSFSTLKLDGVGPVDNRPSTD